MNKLRGSHLHNSLAVKRDDPKGSPRTLDLGRLAAKLSAIAAELRGEDAIKVGLAESISAARQASVVQPIGAGSGMMLSSHAGILEGQRPSEARQAFAEHAREIYATRRRRTNIFGNAELFGEPAWDILLDLYIAHVDQKPVSVSSACIGSAAPPTTGLRWLGVLADNGLVLREHDPEDQRRVLVRLTDRGLAAMDEYFAGVGLSG